VRNQETPHNTEGLPLFTFTFFWGGEGLHYRPAAQRAPQKTTDPALAGSVRTRCPRTHNWCATATPQRSSRRRTGRRDLHRRRTRRPSCLRRSLEHQTSFFCLGGAFTIGQQRSAPPKKPRTWPSRAPRVRGVHAPTTGATATPQRSAEGGPGVVGSRP
jgi:hypothetical protein